MAKTNAEQYRSYMGRPPGEINKLNSDNMECRSLTKEEIAECAKLYEPPLSLEQQKEQKKLKGLYFSPSIARK